MFSLLTFQFLCQAAVAAVAPYSQLMLLNKGYSYSLSGIMLALADIAAIFIPVLFSGLSDKFGKRRLVLNLALLSSVLFFYLMIRANSLVLTMAFLLIANGSFWSCNPLADSMTNIALKGDMKKYSLSRAVGTCGYVFTGVLFALIAWPNKDDNKSIFMAIASSCVLFGLMSLFMSRSYDTPVIRQANKVSLLKSLKLFSKPFYIVLLSIGLLKITNCIVDRFLSAYLANTLLYAQSFTILIALGACSEVAMMIVFGRLLEKKKIKSYDGLLLACIAMIVRMVLYAFVPNLLGTILAQLTHGLTFGALHVSAINYINRTTPKENNGLAMSLYWGLASTFPNTIGCLGGGFIIEHLGYKTLFLSYTVFTVVALIILVSNKNLLVNKSNSPKPL